METEKLLSVLRPSTMAQVAVDIRESDTTDPELVALAEYCEEQDRLARAR